MAQGVLQPSQTFTAIRPQPGGGSFVDSRAVRLGCKGASSASHRSAKKWRTMKQEGASLPFFVHCGESKTEDGLWRRQFDGLENGDNNGNGNNIGNNNNDSNGDNCENGIYSAALRLRLKADSFPYIWSPRGLFVLLRTEKEYHDSKLPRPRREVGSLCQGSGASRTHCHSAFFGGQGVLFLWRHPRSAAHCQSYRFPAPQRTQKRWVDSGRDSATEGEVLHPPRELATGQTALRRFLSWA